MSMYARGQGEMKFPDCFALWHKWQRTLLPVEEVQEIRVRSLGQEDALE